MLRSRIPIAAVLSFTALCFMTERHAYAYVDPGSGLIILQQVGAAVTGVLFFFRRRIRAFFVRKPAEKE